MTISKSFFKIMLTITLFISTNALGQTEVSGAITSNATWSIANSPYIVTDDIVISDGVTLIIDPGVVVKFDSERMILVNGELNARGIFDNQILFTSNQSSPSPGDWYGLSFSLSSIPGSFVNEDYVSGSIIEYCTIEYGSEINIYGGFPFFINSTIQFMSQSAITSDYTVNTDLAIINCNFFNNNINQGLIIANSLDNNKIIRGNKFSYNFGFSSLLSFGYAKISNNIFSNNIARSSSGYLITGLNNRIYDNKIINNENTMIKNEASSIFFNIFYNNNIGNDGLMNYDDVIWTSDSVYYNLFINNSGGSVFNLDNIYGGYIKNNIIAGNEGSIIIKLLGGQGANFTFSKNSIVNNVGGLFYLERPSGIVNVNQNLLFNNTCSVPMIEISINQGYDYSQFDFTNNNLMNNNASFYYYPHSSNPIDLSIENVFWGTIIDSEIQDLVFDWYDDSQLGCFIDYDPWLTSPNIDAPISPPGNVEKSISNGNVILTWNVNLESDIVGYMIHHGNFTGYSYETNIDIGNVNTYTLSGVSIDSSISITAYDNNIDGSNDQVEGYQSWFSVALPPPNAAPVVSNLEVTIDEDIAYNGSLSATDIDGDELTYSIVSNPSNGIVSLTGASFIYTPNEHYNGTDSFTFNVTDGELISEVGTVDITINPVADYPVAYNNTDSLDEDSTYNGTLTAMDIDGDDLTYAIANNPINGSVTIQNTSAGDFTYVPNENFYGDDSFTFTASKESGDIEYVSEPATIYLSVLPINDAPVFETMEDLSIDEDNTLAIQLSAVDVDGDYLMYEVESIDNIDTYLFNNNNLDSLLFVPEPNWSGPAEVLIHVEDGNGEFDNTSFTLTVNPMDDEPFVEGYIEDVYLDEDFQDEWSVDLDEQFEDIDGELTYTITFQNTNVINALIDGSMLTLEAIADANGETDMYVTASNPTRASVTDTVFVRVFEVNDEPILYSLEPITMNEDEPYMFSSMAELMESEILVDVDTDLEELDFEFALDNEQVQVEWDGNLFTQPIFISDEDYSGSAIITLWVYDAFYWVSSDIDLTIVPVNDVPFFVSEMQAPVGLNLEFSIPLQAEDIDSETLVVSLSTGETNPFWLSIEDNTLYGIPDELGMFPVYLSLSDGEISILDTFHLHVENFIPEITSITDVPNDQGGRVYLGFNSSFFDNGDVGGQSYSFYRYDNLDADSSGWVLLGSGDAIGDESYTYEATTLSDSLSATDNGYTEFRVVASMSGGIFHSESMMGYSIDNIAPGVPDGLMAVAMDDNIQLSWNPNSEDDFQYYVVEKSIDGSFSNPESYQVSDTSFIDVEYVSNQTNYYRLIAVDYSGNHSNYTGWVEATILLIDENTIPEVFALHQNYPNPFNPTTQIKYDLPQDALVTISIYDLMGRSIKSLVNANQAAGYCSVRWDATNNYGEAVSAGMYIYVIQAGEFRSTKKMVLLK